MAQVMGNVIVGQSGGPTAVINSSLAGVYKTARDRGARKVFGMLHGIQGLLEERVADLSKHIRSDLDIDLLKRTPSSFLGSCRYKLPEIKDNQEIYDKIFAILDKLEIEYFFYIGGNDSMDTVDALSQWAKANNIDKRFVGIPKTVDNDLMVTDHCPGFASGAKFANEVVNATWLDYNVYTREEVFILETMGRDAGWLAGSTVVTGRVDLVVLPEIDFDKEQFLAQVKKCMEEKGKCYIVTSEGAHYADGTYISAGEAKNDGFGHAILGGAGETLKNMILEAGIAPRAKVQDLSTAARSSNFAQSLVDVSEAFELGMSAHMRSADGKFTGEVVAVQREYIDGKYNAKFISGPAENFANHVKHVPTEWILPNYQGLTKEFYDYITPLIEGEPTLIMENGIPKTIKPFNMR